MTSSSARDLYRRWLDELWAGHPGAAEQLVGEDFVGHWPNRDVHGPDELAATIAETRGMFTELTFELAVGPIIDGELVAARWTGRGVTPEGNISFFGNDILRVADGRFVEYWTASSSGS
ncbi:nuclear transport factor 2 family protein [Blastococcus sp. TF02-09]|uniref:ester cyclase n=1 Tax=Blastococcus sp. TF02-09 TaxID=2250576 RepID=UPI000DEAB771|nr:nuclear transport factor 2 family protein [Blastococcus sp. TF02-9]RBY81104.1 nuclear transport factor 2 family protein [Blastococcus sp. TF02-9]